MEWVSGLPWWAWALVALLLSVIELLVPGSFFFIFFAAGAVITALAKLLLPDLSTSAALLIFGAVSVVALVLFRKRLLGMKLFREPDPSDVDNLAATVAIALESIDPNNHGKVELRGAPWTALNAGKVILQKGQRCRVTKTDGMNLEVISE